MEYWRGVYGPCFIACQERPGSNESARFVASKVIVDYGTKEGFQYVGDARDYLLRRGRKETKAATQAAENDNSLKHEASTSSTVDQNTNVKVVGSHVVAPVRTYTS